VKYIYIKEKNIAFSDKNKGQSYFSNNENIVFSDKKINNTTSDKTDNSTKLGNKTSRLIYNTGINLIANKENISTASKEEIANIEIENKALLSEKTLVNESVKTENEVLENTVIDSVLISGNKLDFLTEKADNQAIVSNEEDKKELKTPAKIEPVKNRKLNRWTIGINAQSGVLEQKGGHGFFNGAGLSISTQFSPKWRIKTSFDIQEIEFENRNNKDFYKHKKPDIDPNETIVRWNVRHQPLAQWSLGIERLFNYKKIEAFVGVGTGVTFIFPYEIRYDAIDKNTGKPSSSSYKSEAKDAYSAFAGFQANAGVSYPIYRKISATLSTHYQYNSNNSKLYWQNQWSGKIGLNYRF
jgi:hypothetical protein